MVKHKGLCPSLKKSVEFDVKEIIELPTKRGIKYQVKGDFEGRTCSTFCSKAKAMELKKALGLDVMEAESEDGTGQAHQEEGVSPIENNVQPLAQGQDSMESMPVQETVSTPITNTSIGVEPIENLDLTDADALNNMTTEFDEAPQMVADIEIAPSEPEGDGRSIGNIRPMNEDVPLHAESEDGTGQAHQEEGVSPIENNVQPLAQGQEPMEAMPVQETVSTPITNTSIGVEPIDNLGLDGADAIGSMNTEFDDAPEILANFQIGMMQPFGEGRSIGNNTPMNPDVPLHAEEFKAEAEIEIIDPTDNTTLPTPPPVCFVDKIPPSVWENLSVLEKIHYAETGDESILICPNCGISKEQLRLQDGFGVCGNCAYQKYFAPSHWITEPMIVENITEDEIEFSERLPADVDMPSMKNPQKDLQTMIVPYFVWDKIYTQFTGGIKAEQDLSGLNYVLTYHGMMKPQLDNAIEVAEGEYDIMFGAERYQAQVFKAENNQGYYLDAETVIPLTKKGKVRTMSGKPHTPRELKEDKDITPEEALMRKEMKAETFEGTDFEGNSAVIRQLNSQFRRLRFLGMLLGDDVKSLNDLNKKMDMTHPSLYVKNRSSNKSYLTWLTNEQITEELGLNKENLKQLHDEWGVELGSKLQEMIFDLSYTIHDRMTSKQTHLDAESFDVEFDDWAEQEMLTHGKTVSFKEWAKEEGKKHGDMDLTDWAEEEEMSHDERYGAESFEADENEILIESFMEVAMTELEEMGEISWLSGGVSYTYNWKKSTSETKDELIDAINNGEITPKMMKDCIVSYGFKAETFEADDEVYSVSIGYVGLGKDDGEQFAEKLFTLKESVVDRLEDEWKGVYYFDINDDSQKKPMSYKKITEILERGSFNAETFEAEVVQYDVLKGKPSEGGIVYAESISIHDSVNEAEKEARMESKNIAEDEAIYVVEERFDDETLESKPSTIMFSIEKPLMEDEMSDNFEAEILQKVGLKEGSYLNRPNMDSLSYMRLDIYPQKTNKEKYVLLVRPYHISKVSEKYLNDILTSEHKPFPYGSKYSWANEQNRNGLIWDDEIKGLRRMKTQEKEIFDNNEVMMKKAIKKLEKKIKNINKPNDDSQKQDIPSLKSVGVLLGLGALGAYFAPQNVRNFLNKLNK